MDELRGEKGGRRVDEDSDREAVDVVDWDDGGALASTYVSTGGKVLSLDEVLDIILDKDDKRKRKFGTG